MPGQPILPAFCDHGGREEVDAAADHADVVGLGELGELHLGLDQLEAAPVVNEGPLLRVVEHCEKNGVISRGKSLPYRVTHLVVDLGRLTLFGCSTFLPIHNF